MHAPPPHPHRRAWVEVDTGAIGRNLTRIRRHVGPDARIIPMVKCDGYGLGVDAVVAGLAPGRPFGYGVATVDEGRELRDLGIREPVMVCCPVPPAELPRAVAAHLVPTISDLDSLTVLASLASPAPAPPLPFQIEVDTGMGRAGFPLVRTSRPASRTPAAEAEPARPGSASPSSPTSASPSSPTNASPSSPTTTAPPAPPAPTPTPTEQTRTPWWPRVRRAATHNLHLFGIFTHLHSADEPDLTSARRQIARFDDFIRNTEGIEPGTLLHCANSAGTLRLSSETANAVRPGIYLYGGSPGPGTELARNGGARQGTGRPGARRSRRRHRRIRRHLPLGGAGTVGRRGHRLRRRPAADAGQPGVGDRGRAAGPHSGTDLHGHHGGRSWREHIAR